jgi:hypothetical protein
MDQHEKELLRKLESLLGNERTRIAIDTAISAAKMQLAADRQRIAGSVPVSLSKFGDSLPSDIKSCRVFALRAGSEFKIERHPNSHQRVLSLEGTGKIRVFAEPGPWTFSLRSDSAGPLELRWASVRENMWHQPVAGNENWVVLAFHTASEGKLIDEQKDSSEIQSTSENQ